MLGDEVQLKAVKMTYNGVEITSKVINNLIKNYLQASEKQTYGKQNLKKLNRKGYALDSIPVTNGDVKGLQRERPTLKERMVAAVQKAKERNVSRKQHEKTFERGRDER